jgi:hypothetical protein
MSSVLGMNSNLWLTQATASQGTGTSQDTQSAVDAFAALLAQALALQCQAQTAGTTGTTSTSASAGTSAGATGVQSTAASGQTAISSDLSTLSQALGSGNLAAAQQAFQSLQNDLQGAQQTHHHHHHHHGWAAAQSGQDGQSAGASGTATTTGSTGTSTAS